MDIYRGQNISVVGDSVRCCQSKKEDLSRIYAWNLDINLPIMGGTPMGTGGMLLV